MLTRLCRCQQGLWRTRRAHGRARRRADACVGRGCAHDGWVGAALRVGHRVRYGRCVGGQARFFLSLKKGLPKKKNRRCAQCPLWPLRGGAGTPPVYYSVYLLYLLYWYKRTNTDAAASRLGASSLKNSTKSLTVALLGLDNPTPAALRPSSSSDAKDESPVRPRTAKKASGSGRQVRNDGVVWKSY